MAEAAGGRVQRSFLIDIECSACRHPTARFTLSKDDGPGGLALILLPEDTIHAAFECVSCGASALFSDLKVEDA